MNLDPQIQLQTAAAGHLLQCNPTQQHSQHNTAPLAPLAASERPNVPQPIRHCKLLPSGCQSKVLCDSQTKVQCGGQSRATQVAYTATAVRPLRPQLSAALLLHRPLIGSNTSTDPCSCSLPALPPITYSRPPTHATLQLERACCISSQPRRQKAGEVTAGRKWYTRTTATVADELRHGPPA